MLEKMSESYQKQKNNRRNLSKWNCKERDLVVFRWRHHFGKQIIFQEYIHVTKQNYTLHNDWWLTSINFQARDQSQ